MKKIIAVILVLVLVFIVLTYWSLWSTSEEYASCRIIGRSDLETIDFRKHDSVWVAASILYESNFVKDLMQGTNYREAWATPVRVPIVYLDTLYGGLTVIEEGGGKQTHSLELESPRGIRYTLRGVNKDPKALVPQFARTLGLENIVIDGISAQHPYAAEVVAALSDAAGVLHTHPQTIFVPRQPALGTFNEKYGNGLYLLEFETEGKVNWTNFKNVLALLDTEGLQQLKLDHGPQVSIDQEALVRARLLDLIIGDWDRHSKQWGWVIQKKDGTFRAIPLPSDRDNAFFRINGAIPTIISDKNITPGLQPFKEEIEYLPGLVMDFDVYFLTKTPESIFVKQARELQAKLTDDVIDRALHTWPPDLYDLDAGSIKSSIMERRDNLIAYARAFRTELDKRQLLREPLKGSEDMHGHPGLEKCFECGEPIEDSKMK